MYFFIKINKCYILLQIVVIFIYLLPQHSPNANPIENMFGFTIIKSEFSKQIIVGIIDKNISGEKNIN